MPRTRPRRSTSAPTESAYFRPRGGAAILGPLHATSSSCFVAQMRGVEAGYRATGRELTLEEWEREPASATFLDGIARLTSALQ